MGKSAFDQLHFYRWVTAAVALPLLIGIFAFGRNSLVLCVVVLVTAAGMLECFSLLLSETSIWFRLAALSMGVLLPLASFWRGPLGLTSATIAMLFAILLMHLLLYCRKRPVLSSLGAAVFTQLYLPFALSHIVLLLSLSGGRRWVVFVLAVTFAGDTGAYYVGKRWGRHKLLPAVSPGKTVEGAAGGLFSSLTLAVLSGKLLLSSAGAGLGFLLSLGFALAVVGQMGDLMESMLKRLSQVKDTGGILPGHGGLLDRLDSLLFAFPLTYYVAVFFT